MEEANPNVFKGLLWGTALSIPLWLSFFGWVKVVLVVISAL